MSDKVKLRMTIVMEYEVDPVNYGTEKVSKMCAVDEDGLANNLDVLFSMFEREKWELIVDSPWIGFLKERGIVINP